LACPICFRGREIVLLDKIREIKVSLMLVLAELKGIQWGEAVEEVSCGLDQEKPILSIDHVGYLLYAP